MIDWLIERSIFIQVNTTAFEYFVLSIWQLIHLSSFVYLNWSLKRYGHAAYR